MKHNTFARIALTLSATALLPISALAAPLPPQPGQPGHRIAAPAPAPADLTVSYYAGNPAQGGRLLKTVALAPQARGQRGPGPASQNPAPQNPVPQNNGTPRPPRPEGGQPGANRPEAAQGKHHPHGGLAIIKAQAPAGATFAVVRGPDGRSRTIDLTQMAQPGQPGQPHQPGQPGARH